MYEYSFLWPISILQYIEARRLQGIPAIDQAYTNI